MANANSTHINHLPFDCLSKIFGHLPQSHRISKLAHVCHYWQYTVESMCYLTRSLVIDLCEDYEREFLDLFAYDMEHYERTKAVQQREGLLLRHEHFTTRVCKRMAQLFPQIKQLIVRCNDPEIEISSATTEMVCGLLRQWPCLVEFGLWRGGNYPIFNEHFLPKICSTINHYLGDTLGCLDLFIPAFGRKYQHHPSVDLSNVLPRLERLRIQLPNSTIQLIQIEQLDGLKVKEITLCNSHLWTEEEQNRFCERNPALLANLTRLNICVIETAFLAFVCSHFVSLQFVQLDWSDNWEQYLRELAKLPHLIELKLHGFKVDPKMAVRLSLPNLKKLTLCNEDQFNEQKLFGRKPITVTEFCTTLATQFPGLETLVIVCKIDHEAHQIETNLAHLAYQHFAHLKKLKLILNAPEWQNTSDACHRAQAWCSHLWLNRRLR